MAEPRRRPRRRPREAEPEQEPEELDEPEEPEEPETPEDPEDPEEPEEPDEDYESDEDEQGEDPAEDEPMQTEKGETRTDTSATLQPLTEATADDWLGSNDDPDVMLSVPNLGIDHIGIKVDNIRAHVELHAKVLDLLELHVGAQVSIEMVEIDIENTRVQAMLKVNLKEVSKIVDRLLTSIDNNPEILTNLTGGLGRGLEGALKGGTGDDDSGDSGDLHKSIEGKADADYDEAEEEPEDDEDEEDEEDYEDDEEAS